MAEDKMSTEALERRIVSTLEAAPRFKISPDFARKIASALPAQRVIRLTPTRYGARAAMLCVVVLMVLMLVIAAKTHATSLYWLSIESLFCTQFVLLAVWLVARRYRSQGSY
jgi:hypothetical protein